MCVCVTWDYSLINQYNTGLKDSKSYAGYVVVLACNEQLNVCFLCVGFVLIYIHVRSKQLFLINTEVTCKY